MITDVYEVPQEHRDFLDGIRQVVQGVVAPRAADIDRDGEYPWDVRKALARPTSWRCRSRRSTAAPAPAR